MSNALRTADAFEGFRIDRDAVRAGARRQFALSIVLAIVAMAAAAISLAQPMRPSADMAQGAHRGAASPTFVTSPNSTPFKMG
jgi:hypothetical protein